MQKQDTLGSLERFLNTGDVYKQVLSSPCCDRFGGRCLSRDRTKCVPCDRFGRPKGDRKRKGDANNSGDKKKNGNNNDQKKKVTLSPSILRALKFILEQ